MARENENLVIIPRSQDQSHNDGEGTRPFAEVNVGDISFHVPRRWC